MNFTQVKALCLRYPTATLDIGYSMSSVITSYGTVYLETKLIRCCAKFACIGKCKNT